MTPFSLARFTTLGSLPTSDHSIGRERNGQQLGPLLVCEAVQSRQQFNSDIVSILVDPPHDQRSATPPLRSSAMEDKVRQKAVAESEDATDRTLEVVVSLESEYFSE